MTIGRQTVRVVLSAALAAPLGCAWRAREAVDARERARKVATMATIKRVEQAVEMFRAQVGSYPTTAEGLEILVNPPTDGPGAARLRGLGPLLPGRAVPTDAWKRPLKYELAGGRGAAYRIWSVGPDGQDGTDDDISSTGGLR